MQWYGIEPGDVGFDGGQGFFGWIIRRSTGAFGHAWVYHKYLGMDEKGRETWDTVEAGPTGIKHQVRNRPPSLVARMWHSETERQGILEASESCVGAKYGWGEIVRLALHTIGIKVKGWSDNPNRMICSNHAATSIIGGVPHLEITLPYRPQHIWPQRLAEWCVWTHWITSRARNR